MKGEGRGQGERAAWGSAKRKTGRLEGRGGVNVCCGISVGDWAILTSSRSSGAATVPASETLVFWRVGTIVMPEKESGAIRALTCGREM